MQKERRKLQGRHFGPALCWACVTSCGERAIGLTNCATPLCISKERPFIGVQQTARRDSCTRTPCLLEGVTQKSD